MNRKEIRDRIEEIGILPAIRASSADDAIFAAETVAACGITVVEVTMTTPDALRVIQEVAVKIGMLVGAGTVWDVDTARKCIDAGATFITATGYDADVVRTTEDAGICSIPGALTPSEIMAAWKAGADLIKVFPCSQMGGPSYIRALRGPFPDIPLIAAGGVTQHSLPEFFEAGATAIGVGQHLIPREDLGQRRRERIRELATRFLARIHQARYPT